MQKTVKKTFPTDSRASARDSSFDTSRIWHCVRDYAMASTVRCNGTLDEKR